MLLPFITGWIIGSVSLYSYCVLTAQESPRPECMDCNATKCDGCGLLHAQEDDFRMAA